MDAGRKLTDVFWRGEGGGRKAELRTRAEVTTAENNRIEFAIMVTFRFTRAQIFSLQQIYSKFWISRCWIGEG